MTRATGFWSGGAARMKRLRGAAGFVSSPPPPRAAAETTGPLIAPLGWTDPQDPGDDPPPPPCDDATREVQIVPVPSSKDEPDFRPLRHHVAFLRTAEAEGPDDVDELFIVPPCGAYDDAARGRLPRFNGASVPAPFWWIMRPMDPRVVRAALVHDMLYIFHGVCSDTSRKGFLEMTRRDADALFFLMLVDDGFPPWRAWLAWLTVAWFGGSRWEEPCKLPKKRTPWIWPDAPTWAAFRQTIPARSGRFVGSRRFARTSAGLAAALLLAAVLGPSVLLTALGALLVATAVLLLAVVAFASTWPGPKVWAGRRHGTRWLQPYFPARRLLVAGSPEEPG